jgi:ABC-type uncharacterized transport system ATPase subunit
MEISLKDIHKTYGRVKANQGINLDLAPGRIYGLLGENGAGKSTLMRILAGHTRPDRGEIQFDKKVIQRLTPATGMAMGVGMLYQDPSDFPNLRVWENFVLGGRKRKYADACRELTTLAESLDFQFNPDRRLGELTVGERQQLEIMRLLDAGVKTLILDEPTTGISPSQKDLLFQTLKRLSQDSDRIIIMVTHKLSEARELCDEILVMRQGRMTGQLEPPYDPNRIVELMFGTVDTPSVPEAAPPDAGTKPLLVLKSAEFLGDKFVLSGVNLTVRPGEIIGLAGLEGNGQQVLLRGLAGLNQLTNGRMEYQGRPLRTGSYIHIRRAGIHFLPASRLEQALYPDLSVTDHVHLAFPNEKSRLDEFYQQECVGRFNLAAGPEACARALSGGNQQRLLLSLIPAQVKLLLMENPTRGLDVGSAAQVWEYLVERCRQGASLLYFSADLDEILAYSQRVLVFYDRRIVADIPRDQASMQVLGEWMAGGREAA